MAEKKQPSKTYTAKKKTAPAESKSAARKRIEEEQRITNMKKEQYRLIWRQTVPYLLILAAILEIVSVYIGADTDIKAHDLDRSGHFIFLLEKGAPRTEGSFMFFNYS